MIYSDNSNLIMPIYRAINKQQSSSVEQPQMSGDSHTQTLKPLLAWFIFLKPADTPTQPLSSA